jgi:site-specific recombinase XerD
MPELAIVNLRHAPVDQMVELWLDSKTRRSNSQRTRRTYSDTIRSFRLHLQSNGFELDRGDVLAIAAEAQKWADRDEPAGSTYNHRLSVIKSFYSYARKLQFLACENPIDYLDRARQTAYADSKALDLLELKRQLEAIDKTTLIGKRDYTFLRVALHTGRRRAELIGLRMNDIELIGEQMELSFRRCKGGKPMRDRLTTTVTCIVREYLQELYGVAWQNQPPEAAVWASFRRGKGGPIGSTTTYRIVKERLGITAVHRLRHTFAHAMDEVGASITEIQERLGHSDIRTTTLYLSSLRRAINPHGEKLDALFGIDEQIEDNAVDDSSSNSHNEICASELTGTSDLDAMVIANQGSIREQGWARQLQVQDRLGQPAGVAKKSRQRTRPAMSQQLSLWDS